MAKKLLRFRIKEVRPDHSQYKQYDIAFEPEEPTYFTTTVEMDDDEVDLDELIEYVGTMGIQMYAQSLKDKDERDDILLTKSRRRSV
jgi:hypothetical protein